MHVEFELPGPWFLCVEKNGSPFSLSKHCFVIFLMGCCVYGLVHLPCSWYCKSTVTLSLWATVFLSLADWKGAHGLLSSPTAAEAGEKREIGSKA